MATYTIIGGDQKPYSSVTADDIRRWIADSRLNAQSLAKEEHDTEWRPLSAFPEFADALAASSAPPPSISSPVATASGGRDAALQLVKGPAIGLKVTAILGLVLVAAGLVMNIMTLGGFQIFPQQINDPQMQKLLSSLSGGLGIVQGIIGGVVGVIVLIGAAKMQKLQSYQFALTASIVAMVPCISPCCVFGLPFGIWALVVLNKPEVKSQFG
jgi:preprotein translocase subunit YajC